MYCKYVTDSKPLSVLVVSIVVLKHVASAFQPAPARRYTPVQLSPHNSTVGRAASLTYSCLLPNESNYVPQEAGGGGFTLLLLSNLSIVENMGVYPVYDIFSGLSSMVPSLLEPHVPRFERKSDFTLVCDIAEVPTIVHAYNTPEGYEYDLLWYCDTSYPLAVKQSRRTSSTPSPTPRPRIWARRAGHRADYLNFLSVHCQQPVARSSVLRCGSRYNLATNMKAATAAAAIRARS